MHPSEKLKTYLASIQRIWLPDPWIRIASQERANDFSLVLEHGAGKGRLTAVVEPVRVGTVLKEERDEGGVAVVGG